MAALALVMTASRAAAQQETILHNFPSNAKDGDNPANGLVADAKGNMYGTTGGGGSEGSGTVFEMVRGAGGSWTEKVLHAFDPATGDGFNPVDNLVFDRVGNLYGTTFGGGAYGYGMVFELSSKAGGGWTEKILYSFQNNGTDGHYPYAGVVLDAEGRIYGTAYYGGASAGGTVFGLSPRADGSWGEKILHTFQNNGSDGYYPAGGLNFDAAGNLYGTTTQGGTDNNGTAFELKHTAGGGWSEVILHSFLNNGTDGYDPDFGLISDAAGSLYGTTSQGGSHYAGAVFELTSAVDGSWTETVLYSFDNNGTDGVQPQSALIFDAAGNLYGVTEDGGLYGNGTAYKLAPGAGGVWIETLLHSFGQAKADDGDFPRGGLAFDAAGNLYGTSQDGGSAGGGDLGKGIVFEITP